MYKIPKCDIWSGSVRNAGIMVANGEYIIYLDADDKYTETYLEELSNIMSDDKDWYFVDDIIFKNRQFIRRKCYVNKKGYCGTSNIIHKRSLNAYWNPKDNYAHDWNFINILKSYSKNYSVLNVYGYVVMHIPQKYDI